MLGSRSKTVDNWHLINMYLSEKISIPNGLLGIKTKMGLFKKFTSVCVFQLSFYVKLKSYKRGAKVKNRTNTQWFPPLHKIPRGCTRKSCCEGHPCWRSLWWLLGLEIKYFRLEIMLKKIKINSWYFALKIVLTNSKKKVF